MSPNRYSGGLLYGVKARLREKKRREAEERNARTAPERRRAFREGPAKDRSR